MDNAKTVREIADQKLENILTYVPKVDDEVVTWNHTISDESLVNFEKRAETQELFGVDALRLIGHHRRVPDIDPDYLFDKKLSALVLSSIIDNDTTMLVGGTGCGKSSLVAQLAARMNWPVSKVNLHGETTATDFVGQWVIEGRDMKYKYGVLPTAMKEGHILILEEIDAAEPSILFQLQNVTEENGYLILAENGGEIIKPHPLFRIVSTANTLGRGDETGFYTGTHILNESQLDRWKVVFKMGYMHYMKEAKLLSSKFPNIDFNYAQSLVSLATYVRNAAEKEEVYCTFSTRRLLALAEKINKHGKKNFRTAFELTVLNKLSEDDRESVEEIAQRVIPTYEEEEEEEEVA
jgi:cobaltochelatase CobS